MPEVRVDKWLWAIRAFKTRSLAAEACKKGRIVIDNVGVKPSRMLRINEVLLIRKPPIVYSFKVTGLIDRRVSAKLAAENYEDLTSAEELQKLDVNEVVFVKRERGTGRPTKKERRLIDKLKTDD
ncbi:MAG: RNA-binding S4 domain-containing protein [Bacteroidales bacterium]|nr:RNA-binding S4 domain-containing protein [Bacteroidales bacterium]